MCAWGVKIGLLGEVESNPLSFGVGDMVFGSMLRPFCLIEAYTGTYILNTPYHMYSYLMLTLF